MLFETIKKIIEENGGSLFFDKEEWDVSPEKKHAYFLSFYADKVRNPKEIRLRLRKDILNEGYDENEIREYMAEHLIKVAFTHFPLLDGDRGTMTTPLDSI